LQTLLFLVVIEIQKVKAAWKRDLSFQAALNGVGL